MHWLVAYRAIYYHSFVDWSHKGKGRMTVHATEPVDWTSIIEIDPDEWVEGLRADLDKMRKNPEDNGLAIELVEIFSLVPLDDEATEERKDLGTVFEIMGVMPERWLAH